MLPPELSLTCLTPATCLGPVAGLAGGLAGGVSNAAAEAVLGAVNASMSVAADWLLGHVIGLIDATTGPRLDAGWFRDEAGLMATVVASVLLPVLMGASIGPVLRQDARRLFRVWGVGLPVAVLAGVAGAQLAGLALGATDELCRVILDNQSQDLGVRFSAAMATGAMTDAPVFVQMMLSALTVAGCLLVWLEMMVRDAGVYVTVFFMPLVLVGYIWPATAGFARRGVEILASLILSKFVIVAALTLGLAALNSRGPDAVVAAAGLMLLAGFAPFTLMRLAPVVEAAAIGHLEGMSRRPARAAARATTMAAGAADHPVSRLLASAGDQPLPGPSGPAPVAPQMLPERPPDFPLDGQGAPEFSGSPTDV